MKVRGPYENLAENLIPSKEELCYVELVITRSTDSTVECLVQDEQETMWLGVFHDLANVTFCICGRPRKSKKNVSLVDNRVEIWIRLVLCKSHLLPLRYPVWYDVNNSTELSPPSEASNSSASQKIPRILCNPKVHFRVNNSPSSFRNFRQINPVHAFPLIFIEIHYNIILPSIPMSLKWSLSLSLCLSQNSPLRTSMLPSPVRVT
jgi:hypothetical protein